VKQRIIDGLQKDAGASLVALAIDHILSLPASQLIDPHSLAKTAVSTLRHGAESGQTEAWIRGQIELAKASVPDGTLRSRMPAELIAPLREAIVLPVTPNRAIVGRLIEHGAVENLLRELLVGALQGFAKRIRPQVPGAEKATSRLRSLKRVGEGMLGGLGAEIERQAEQKARDFVDSILSSVIGQAADDLCDPAKAASYGRFRGHLLDQVLDTPLQDLSIEINKMDTDALLATSTAAACAMAERPGLEAELSALFSDALSKLEGQTLADILADADVSDDWRTEAETRATAVVHSLTATDDFSKWLDRLLAD